MNLIPFNPFPGHALSTLERRGDRTLPRHPQCERRDRHHAAHARRRHRRRLRTARRPRARSHDRASRLETRLSGGAIVKRAHRSWSRVRACICSAACVEQPAKTLGKPQPERAAEINLEIGIDYLRKGNLPQAKEKIDRALEQNPRNAKAHSVAGMLYDRLGDREKGGLALRTRRVARSGESGHPATTTRCTCARRASTSAARSWRSRPRTNPSVQDA